MRTDQDEPAVLVWLGVPIVWLVAIAANRIDMADTEGYVFASLAHGVLYAGAMVWVLWRSRFGGPIRGHATSTLTVILIVALLCRALALTAEPNLTTDAYRYVWDGRIQWDGWNPYAHIPADETLAHLRDDAIYPHINQKERAVTIYPPFAEMLFALANAISDSLKGPKVVMVAMDLLVMAGLFVWLRMAGLPRERLLVYAWHPLPIWEFSGQAHIDAAATALLVLGIVAVWQRRQAAAGGLLALAVMTKYFPLVFMPALWRRWDWRMPTAFVGVCIALALPYWLAGQPNLLGYLGTHLDNEGYQAGWGFHPIWLLKDFSLAHPPGGLYVAFALLVLGSLALYSLFARAPEEIRPDHLVLLAAAFTWLTSPHYPWYFAWLVPLLAVYPSASVLAMTVLSVLFYLPRSPDGITWTELYPVVFYLPLLTAAAFMACRRSGLLNTSPLRP